MSATRIGTSHPSSARRLVLRRIGAAILGTGITLITLIALLWAGAAAAPTEALMVQDGGSAASVPSSDGPIVVAVALGRSGTDAADALAPYEVFARSTHFSVYTVAATSDPVPLNGGLSVLPTYTFEDAAIGAAPAPDVVVVPAVNDPAGDDETELRDYVVDGARSGAQILGVCAGSRVLAATGLLDGHRATSHWSRIIELEESNPDVTWVTGQRYVQDRGITTSAGVTSGIPAALRLMQQLAGDTEAERVGADMAYPSWSLDASTAIPVQRFAPTDLGVGLNAVLPWFRPTVGVALAEGVGEVDASAPFEVAGYSSATTALPVGAGSSITTAHGLVLLTAPTSAAPSSLDRVLVASSGDPEERASLDRWARGQGIPSSTLRTSSGHGGFDAALADLAAHGGPGLADSTAKMLDYPARSAEQAQLWVPPRPGALLVVACALALTAGLTPLLVRVRQRRRPAGHSVRMHSA
ncbi:DJ-1/PfpI family protein [Arthrobacter agilis]|uniref:DJ-1/PfpI family protein n=1 Tax=Arthrobacter agilis TaxID=37921 RepID=UPI00278276FE|nr:DJ-1/PfpI family protein [Arthrobacter agilis]MDQ0735015.1 putative intracellular protease/amidase [Arthrobacter agilis]